MADTKTMEEYAKTIEAEHGKTIEELYGAEGFGYNWEKLSDVDRTYWNYADSMPRFEPFNSANGETWKDYQSRQKEFNDATEKHLCAYYKKLKDADRKKKARANDTDKYEAEKQSNREYKDKHREELNAKSREDYSYKKYDTDWFEFPKDFDMNMLK